ncbi:Unknown protein sequence [Pseudomonas syringae pv. primulae]|uniref:Uncharacterized protein n=1 Tax=Pseudomonas syringae pv. primulae TaxID=251707 RepID=A0A0P9Y055_9PSED|nr:Unknown protein sequence [Pseudomonas syringae pv. primulae]
MAHPVGIVQRGPGVGGGKGQLTVRRLLIEAQLVVGMVDGGRGLHVAPLGDPLLGHQVETVERTFDAAHRLPAVHQDFGGAIQVGPGDPVEVVQAVVFENQPGRVMAEEVVGVRHCCRAVGIVHFDGGLTVTGVADMAVDARQAGASGGTREGMPGIVVIQGFVSTGGGAYFADAQQAVQGPVGECPPGLLLGGQEQVCDAVVGIRQFQHEAHVGLIRMQVHLDGAGAAGQAQQAAPGIPDLAEQGLAVESVVGQRDRTTVSGLYLDRQGNRLGSAAEHLQDFHLPGLVRHPVKTAAQVIGMKAVEFLLFHEQASVGGGFGDLEGFASAEREDLRSGTELRQLQTPAHAVAGVAGVEGAEGQGQRHSGAGQVIGLEFRQGDGHGVQPGARVNAAADETHEVEGVGMQGRGHKVSLGNGRMESV